jgi:hypothetical protein
MNYLFPALMQHPESNTNNCQNSNEMMEETTAQEVLWKDK